MAEKKVKKTDCECCGDGKQKGDKHDCHVRRGLERYRQKFGNSPLSCCRCKKM